MNYPAVKYLGQRLSRPWTKRQLERQSSVGGTSSDLFPSTRTLATKVSALSLNSKKRKGKKITMVTAYDYPSAIQVARAGIDIVLVGDSVAMVELGHETTQQLSMEHILHHCTSVKRGLEFVKSGSMLVGDMPFGSYEFEDTDVALRNAYRFVKEGGCDAVKMEVRKHIDFASSKTNSKFPYSQRFQRSIRIICSYRVEVLPEPRLHRKLLMEEVRFDWFYPQNSVCNPCYNQTTVTNILTLPNLDL
jgi:hypothetical protein